MRPIGTQDKSLNGTFLAMKMPTNCVLLHELWDLTKRRSELKVDSWWRNSDSDDLSLIQLVWLLQLNKF